MSRDSYPWLNDLLGRQADLESLIAAYRSAKLQGTVSATAIVAESGVGKTRLIQAFYQQLRRIEDPVGYWPEQFPGDLVTLDLNPDLAQQHDLPDGTLPPFLWWAIRFPKPDQRNRSLSGRSSVLDAAPHLMGHFAACAQSATLMEDRRAALDLAIDMFAEVTQDLIPFAGVAKTLVSKGMEAYRLRKKMAELHAAKKPRDFEQLESEKSSQALLSGLSAMQSMVPGLVLPMVLVLDDIHWIDATSVRQLHALLQLARQQQWPLFVLLTAWPAEWKLAASKGEGPLAQLQSSLTGATDAHEPIGKLLLRPIAETPQLISRALPGLNEQQRELIRSKFGGDLYSLSALLYSLRAKRQFFELRDPSRALNTAGMRFLQSHSAERSALIQDRFNELPDATQLGLSVAALLGRRALTRLAEVIANDVLGRPEVEGRDGEPVSPSVSLREEACRWLLNEPMPGICEFVDEVTFELVQDSLHPEEDDFRRAVGSGLRWVDRWIRDGTAEALPRYQLLQLVYCARRLLSLTAQVGDDLNEYDVDKLRAVVGRVGEIVEGMDVDSDVLPSPMAAQFAIQDAQALAELSPNLRSRWLMRAARRGPWLYRGGRPLASQLRQIAFTQLRALAEAVAAGGTGPENVRALSQTARTAVSLSWSLVNVPELNARLHKSLLEDDAEVWSKERGLLLAELESETLGHLASAKQILDDSDSAAGQAAKACLLNETLNMTVSKSMASVVVFEDIASAIECIPLEGGPGEQWLSVLFEDGPLSHVLFGWKVDAYASASRDKILRHVAQELSSSALPALGLFQLLSLGLSLRDLDMNVIVLDLSNRVDLSFECNLELIRRGYAEWVVSWSDNLGDKTLLAIGLLAAQRPAGGLEWRVEENYLDLGWGAVDASLSRLRLVLDRCGEKEKARLLMAVCRPMARLVAEGGAWAGLDAFLEMLSSVAKGAFRDVESIGRYAWMAVCLAPGVPHRFNDADRARMISAYTAALSIPGRFFRLMGDAERLEKLGLDLQRFFKAGGPEEALAQLVSSATLHQISQDGQINLEDWKEASTEAVRLAVLLSFDDGELGEILGPKWAKVYGYLSSGSDEWKSVLPDIRHAIGQGC